MNEWLQNVLKVGIPLLGGYAASQSDSSFFNPDVPQVGYQGGIPDYEAIRTTVPDTYDPDRRAGSGGQRYFTDIQYVPSDATEAVYDWDSYLAGNPDVAADYELNMDELIAGGDPRFSTPEGYAQYHWETFGQDEGRTPPEVIQASGIDQAWDTARTQATALAGANYLNPAQEQNWDPNWYMDPWVTDIFNDLINNPDWTDEEKATQLLGGLEQYNVSPYMLSESVGVPVNQIYDILNKANTSPYEPVLAGEATPSYAERAGSNYFPEQPDTGEEVNPVDEVADLINKLIDLGYFGEQPVSGDGTDTTTGGTGTDTTTGGAGTDDGLDPNFNFASHFTPESREAWETGGDLYSQTFGNYSSDSWESLFPEANLEGGVDAVGQWGEDYLSRSRMNQMMSDVQELGELRATDPTAYDAAYEQFVNTYMTETGNSYDDEMLRRLRQIANGADLNEFMDAVTSGLAESYVDTTTSSTGTDWFDVNDDGSIRIEGDDGSVTTIYPDGTTSYQGPGFQDGTDTTGGSGNWAYNPDNQTIDQGLADLIGSFSANDDGTYNTTDLVSAINYVNADQNLNMDDLTAATGYTAEEINSIVENYNLESRTTYLTNLLSTDNLSTNSIIAAVDYLNENNISAEDIANLTGYSYEEVVSFLEGLGVGAEEPTEGYAAGGYIGGPGDGMADDIPAMIDGGQEARLSSGEFVIPADVVSHLGNGNSVQGADALYQMMENVRVARTGTPQQGPQINASRFMPGVR